MRLQKITLGKIRNGKIMIKQDYIVKVIQDYGTGKIRNGKNEITHGSMTEKQCEGNKIMQI